jgi:hypothetical protein
MSDDGRDANILYESRKFHVDASSWMCWYVLFIEEDDIGHILLVFVTKKYIET